MNESRITIFAGHYGSGKTNLAVNYALYLRKKHEKVVIVDLDIVNPYFRAKDSIDNINSAGIKMVSSAYANTNVDVPSVPADAVVIFDDKQCYGVVDVGGDDRGANALGRYSHRIAQEPDISMLLVVNCYRPMTENGQDAVAIMHEMENAAKFKFNGIVNNSNLGAQTTAQDILQSRAYADEISKSTGLPLVFTTVREDFMETLDKEIPDLFPIKIMNKNIWRV